MYLLQTSNFKLMSYKNQFIWKRSVQLAINCYHLTQHFPQSELYQERHSSEGIRQKGFITNPECPNHLGDLHRAKGLKPPLNLRFSGINLGGV